jgi:hypothetical protein
LSSKANGYCTKREVLVCDFGVLFSHSLYFSPLSRTATQRPVLSWLPSPLTFCSPAFAPDPRKLAAEPRAS